MIKNSVIIGWNVEATRLYDRIVNTPAFDSNVRGFINPNGFKEYRFRTYVDCYYIEDNSGDVNSSRFTRIGNILKRTKLECYPTIIKILKGDIFFIRPHPEEPFIANSFKDKIYII